MIERSDERRQTMYGAGPKDDEPEDPIEAESKDEGTSADDDDDDDDEPAANKNQDLDASPKMRTGGKMDELDEGGIKRMNERDMSDSPSSEMATQGERPGKGQKADPMNSGKIKGTDISDSDEMKGPSHKVERGRAKPEGTPAMASGAIIGSGSQGNDQDHFSNMAHGEREPMAHHTGGHNYKD